MSVFTEVMIWLMLVVLVFLAVRVNQLIRVMLSPMQPMDDPTVQPQGKNIFEEFGKKDDTDMWGNKD